MGKLYKDVVANETLEPIVLRPRTVNVYKDNAELSKDELMTANNIIFDDGIIEKVPGTTLGSSDTPGGQAMGLHRSYGPGGEKVCLRLANGNLKSGPPTFATTVLSGLATDKVTPFINVKGKSYGVNPTDGIIRYNPKTATGELVAIVGPELRKKIVFFEDDETWTGGTADTGTYRADEWSGKAVRSLKLTATASSTDSAYANVTLDLSQYANGKATTDNDIISFYVNHSIRNNINYIKVEFSTGDTTFTNSYYTEIYQAKFPAGDFEWTRFKVKRGSFSTTGTPNWNDVDRVRVTLVANANGTAVARFDFMQIINNGPDPKEIRKQIFSCEANTVETWSGDASLTHVEVQEGYRSVRVQGSGAKTATVTLASAIDLTLWHNEYISSVSDEIVFHVRASVVSQLTDANCLTLRIGQNSSNYYQYTWGTKAALGLVGSNQWVEVRVKKSSFATGAGAPSWSTVAWASLITSNITSTSYIYFDNMRLEEYSPSRTIANFEPSETWTITGNGEMSTDKNGVTEGTQCIKLWGATPLKMSQSYAICDITNMNLTQWADASASTTEDYITFSLRHQYVRYIDYVEIHFDCNNLATFADYFRYRVTKDMFGGGGTKNNQTIEIKIKKSLFEQVGSTAGAGWDKIGAVKVLVNASGTRSTGAVFIDNIVMKRASGITGRYYYKYCFMVKDIASALSPISEYVDTKGSFIYVSNIATSQDSRVTSRKLFRMGGLYPDTWMHVKTIEDNTTTAIVDDIDDTKLVYPMSEDVPQGWINSVPASNLSYDPYEDRIYYWGDSNYKNRVYYSNSVYLWCVNSWNYRDFADEVMYVAPWYGQNIIFFKNKVQKVQGGLPTGQLMDMPINRGPCSYYAVKSMNNMIIYAGWDNVYLFDGYKSNGIGDEVKNYFKGRESYLSTVAIGFNRDVIYVACKAKTGSPTYNNVVLRYHIPTKSWSVLPNWNVNVWYNWDQYDDQDELYLAGYDGHIYSINSSTYRFGASAITSTIELGWMNIPDTELQIDRIELKAKGTAASTIAFTGYRNNSGTQVCGGTITLTVDWLTYTLGPKNIVSALKGDFLMMKLVHSTDNAFFKIKDIVLYPEKRSIRETRNEVIIT